MDIPGQASLIICARHRVAASLFLHSYTSLHPTTARIAETSEFLSTPHQPSSSQLLFLPAFFLIPSPPPLPSLPSPASNNPTSRSLRLPQTMQPQQPPFSHFYADSPTLRSRTYVQLFAWFGLYVFAFSPSAYLYLYICSNLFANLCSIVLHSVTFASSPVPSDSLRICVHPSLSSIISTSLLPASQSHCLFAPYPRSQLCLDTHSFVYPRHLRQLG